MIDYYWFVPVDGDSRYPGGPRPDVSSADFEHLKRTILTAEAAGFGGVLIPFSFENVNYSAGAPYVDAWTTACALGAVTTRIRLLTAVLVGFWHPWIIAHAAATLDHFTGGRVELNVITGARTEAIYGDTLEHNIRYERTAEFIQCLRGLWGEGRFSFSGRFFSFQEASCEPRPVQTPQIPIFFAGQSEAARRVAIGQRVDVQLLAGDTPKNIRAWIEEFCRHVPAEQRPPRFGLRIQAICRESDEEAWRAAQEMFDRFDPAVVRERLRYYAGRDDSQRQWLVGDVMDARSYVIEPSLWSGLKLVRPGATTALVGSPAAIARKMEEYIDAGVSLFIMSGYPQGEAAEWVGKRVLPHITAREAAVPGGSRRDGLAPA